MNENEKMSGMEFGILFSIGVLVIAVGMDLFGRLYEFLEGQAHYLGMGLTALVFVAACMLIYEIFKMRIDGFEHQVENKLSQLEKRVSSAETTGAVVKDEIKFIRTSVQEHWKLCERAVAKIDDFAKPKPAVAASAPEPNKPPTEETKSSLSLDPTLQAALDDLVGNKLGGAR